MNVGALPECGSPAARCQHSAPPGQEMTPGDEELDTVECRDRLVDVRLLAEQVAAGGLDELDIGWIPPRSWTRSFSATSWHLPKLPEIDWMMGSIVHNRDLN
jgi:hypothetical protein